MTFNLRLTPRASPTWRTPSPRSPGKTVRDEAQQCLSLKKVVGTTSTTSNGFDSLEKAHVIAYIAGAVIVVVTFDEDLNASQTCFRAKPSSSPSSGFSYVDSPSPANNVFTVRERYPGSARGWNPSAAASPLANDAADSPNSRFAAKKERTKATTCVALSPSGKFVAAGESGYKPRVLLFSLAPGSYEGPVAALSEHAFGVKCLAFSPDSQYLASLGDINDGFLYVWHINARTGVATLHANNKCTSKVRAIAWMGNSLITVGTRHIKVWKLDAQGQSSPSKRLTASEFSFATPSRALVGRNCLLGNLLDRTFVVVVAADAKRAIVCSEQGEVCVLDDCDATPTLRKVAETGFAVTASTLHLEESVIISGSKGEMIQFNLLKLLAAASGNSVPGDALVPEEPHPAIATVALGTLGSHLVLLDSAKVVHMLKISTENDALGAKRLKEAQLVAHATPCMGIMPFRCTQWPDAALATYSSDGVVLIWTETGDCVRQLRSIVNTASETDTDLPNELRSLAVLPGGKHLVTGDRYGSLSILDVVHKETIFATKAHASEVTNITVHRYDTMTVIASAARDRTIQIFRADDNKTLTLVQTLEEHLAAVTGLQFSDDGNRLVSCSTDRSIIIRDAMTGNISGKKTIAFGINRTIGLKASPLSLVLSTTRQKNSLFVSTNDKTVSQFSLDTGQPWSSFKVTDEDDTDAVNLNMLVELETGVAGTVIAGVSSMDKSVRLYDCDMGQLIDREYGHTGGLAGVTVIDSEAGKSLATVATDRTVFLWSTLSERRPSKDSPGELPDVSQGTPQANAFFSNKPPLRRVLSSSELLSFHRPAGVEPAFPSTPNLPRERSRSPKRRLSRLSTMETPKLQPTPALSATRSRRSNATFPMDGETTKHAETTPSSPNKGLQPPAKAQTMPRSLRRQSSQPVLSTAHRSAVSSAAPSTLPSPIIKEEKELPALQGPTEQICRSLHLFRKKLAASNDTLSHESAKELERELSLTAKLLAEKTPAKSEIIMERLLDRYSEKLVDMLDQRVEERVKELVGAKEKKSAHSVEAVAT